MRGALQAWRPLSRTLGAWLFGLSSLLTIGTWLVLARRVPIADHIPWWFWKPTFQPRPNWWWIFPVLVVLTATLLFIRKSTLPVWANLLALILAGCAVQHMFARVDGFGLDAMRNRMLYTGHARFAKTAVSQDSLLLVAQRYEDMIRIGAISRYPHVTKPPGQLLFYMVTHRIARAMPWIDGNDLQKTATFAAYAFPVLSYLCLVPLYLLSRQCLGGKEAYVPLLLYLSIPSVTLITLHLDQCLYPLLFVTPVSLVVYGLRSDRWWPFPIAGILTGGALFVSFSLLTLLPFLALVLLLDAVAGPSSPPGAWRRRLLVAGTRGGLFLAGILGVEVTLARLLYYDVIESFFFSLGAHQSWKVADWTWLVALKVGIVDILEFMLWSGWTLSLLALVGSARSCCRVRRRPGTCVTVGAAFTALILSLAFFGRTVGETGRLWIFLAPLVALLAARQLNLLARQRIWLGSGAVTLLQVLVVFALKMWQDFY